MSNELIKAYLNTSYVVNMAGEDAAIRVGQDLPEAVVRLVQSMGVGTFEVAVITACNPHSRRLSEAENQSRQGVLAELLGWHRFPIFPATGIGDEGDWSEPGFLIVGVSRSMAVSIGRCCQQNAVIYAEAGGPAELVSCV
ncbi:MAG: DUF3293 domain-containing protein [Gammaproteobacteria bacterium]|nr:DUF3293 domain-containing protein [Gammaproteobacteria bacterium]